MNRPRFALVLLFASAWLGAAGHRALAAQLVPLGPEDEMYADIFSNPPAVAAQPDGSYIAWTGDSWVVAWVAAIFPYDQGTIFVRRSAKK